MKRAALLLVASACGGKTRDLPAANPPPPWGVPISGGTMLVTRDGTRAVIADPDRDRVLDVDLASGDAVEIRLAAGDEPGRLIEDGAGRIHVALRRGGAIATISNDQVIDRRVACGEPRGLAWDPAADAIHVACAGGELVTFPAAGGAATRALRLDRDLRDVIVKGSTLLVTRFRTAELLTIDATGAVVSREAPAPVTRFCQDCAGSGSSTVPAVPAVAWRAIALADGRTLVAHQRQVNTILHPTQGGYQAGCDERPVEDAFTIFGAPGTTPFAIAPFAFGALPVDIAVDAAGKQVAVVTAGTESVTLVKASVLATPDDDQCGGTGDTGFEIDDYLGLPTSIAFDPSGDLLVFYPELPALVVHGGANSTFVLPGPFGYDSGRNFFHTSSSVPAPVLGQPPQLVAGGIDLACASCHPEGRDDGLVWQFDGIGLRRTLSTAGHILSRAPYHWSGDEPDLPTLMDDVFTVRMDGPAVLRSQHLSLGPWLDRVPAPIAPSPADAAAAARGGMLFAMLGCPACHGGPLFTTNAIVDVGTGGMFKVPSLVGVGSRPPYMHDGCAATLADRFGPCGGTAHGNTSGLTSYQIADLVAYLETL